MAVFNKNLSKKTIVLFVDFSFEDMEAMYPKVTLTRDKEDMDSQR